MGLWMAIGATNLCSNMCRIAESVMAAASVAPSASGASLTMGSWPDWLQTGLMLVAVGVGIAIVRALFSLRDRFPKPEKRDAAAFVTMLCDQMWECTNRITTVFAERLRQPPGDIAQMRILVRHLREDMSIPMNFIEQMRHHPPGDWHSAAIFKAFTDWSAQMAATAKQLDDLHQSITYPLIREPVDKHRDEMLVYQYHTEQAFLDRRIDDVLGRAYAFCEVARKALKKIKKDKAAKKVEGDDDGATHDCPCCKRPPAQHRPNVRDPLKPIILPPPPTPPPPSPPAATVPAPVKCCCVVPRACVCQRACICACHCAPTAAVQPKAAC